MWVLARASGLALLSTLAISLVLLVAATGSAGQADAADPIRLAVVDQAAMVTAAPTDRPAAVPEANNEPFGLSTLRAPEGLLWEKWRGVEAQIRAEAEELAECRREPESCSVAAVRFLALVDAGPRREGRARLGEINRAVNTAIRYVSDLVQHGVPDRWTSPLATFAAGRGDCEDFAIAKYVALRAAGIAEGDLRLLLVYDRAIREDHMVLAARHDGRWLILDNRRLLLLGADELPHYAPRFALDHEGVKSIMAPSLARLSDGEKENALTRRSERGYQIENAGADALAPDKHHAARVVLTSSRPPQTSPGT